MRSPFSDATALRADAKRRLDTGEGRLERWWTRKYKRPPNHPLFLSRSIASLMREFYEDLWDERADLERLLETPDSDQGAIRARLAVVCEALGEKASASDTLIEEWERELAAGRVPDLDMTPEQARKKVRRG